MVLKICSFVVNSLLVILSFHIIRVSNRFFPAQNKGTNHKACDTHGFCLMVFRCVLMFCILLFIILFIIILYKRIVYIKIFSCDINTYIFSCILYYFYVYYLWQIVFSVSQNYKILVPDSYFQHLKLNNFSVCS